MELMELGAIFGWFDGWSGDSDEDNFGMKSQDAAVILPSKALNNFTGALKWK